ncbi:MAG TPA: VWA domain-containing protein [Pyrinomonadaceae bacterium]|jgi:VWFA-related protein
MKRFVLAPILFLLCVLSLAAQTPLPTSTPTPSTDNNTLKIPTTLIQVDVTVTDAKGNIVKDLKPGDFEIYENGEKQPITNFAFISNLRTKPEPAEKNKNAIPVPVPPTTLRAEQIRRIFALVVDDLSLSFESAARTRGALKKFVDEQMQAGDLVAIIRTGAGIGALQQFTSDKRQLYAAIERVKWNPSGRGKLSAFTPFEPTGNEIRKASGDTEVDDEDLKVEKDFLGGFEGFQGSTFSTGTLGALKYIVGGMGELKGRKSIVLFSDGFPVFSMTENSLEGSARVADFLKQVAALANRFEVVFYTIDVRGLQTTEFDVRDRIAEADPRKMGQIISDKTNEREAELFDSQDGLVYLAKKTGGMAFLNQNDMTGNLARILNDQSYYLIGYQPDTDNFNADKRRNNKLEVKLTRSDLNVRYRSAFFGNPSEKTVRPSNLSPLQQLTNALSSPFGVNDISVKLNSLFANEKNKGTIVRSLLYINAADLKFEDEPGGMKKTTFEVLGVSFGDNGVVVDQVSNSYTLTVKNENLQKMLTEGFVYYFTFPIKKPGAYQFRVALRDVSDGKIGAASQFIEIPNLKKDVLTVSGLVLENVSAEKWRKMSEEPEKAKNNQNTGLASLTNRMIDTSLRKFKQGSILRYGFEVYNAKTGGGNKPNLTTQLRLFRDGQLVYEGTQLPLDLSAQTDLQRIWGIGALDLGSQTPSGDYILQIVVIDNLAKEKRRLATQFVQFEITE